MSVIGIIVGTAILWALMYATVLLVRSLKLGVPADSAIAVTVGGSVAQSVAATTPATADVKSKKKVKAVSHIDSVPGWAFMLVNVVVMGVAGLLLGSVFGMFFIGFSTRIKMWPGMIVLIAASGFASLWGVHSHG